MVKEENIRGGYQPKKEIVKKGYQPENGEDSSLYTPPLSGTAAEPPNDEETNE